MKYALVTGGSRGIGRAISVKLASMGYHIIVNYVSNEAQAVETIKLIEEAGSTGELLKFDVSNLDETVAAITGWQAAHKGEYIEVVVNNAGIVEDMDVNKRSVELFNKTLTNNATSVFAMSKIFGEHMFNNKTGRIVNISSTNGDQTLYPTSIDYDASKAAINNLTKSYYFIIA